MKPGIALFISTVSFWGAVFSVPASAASIQLKNGKTANCPRAPSISKNGTKTFPDAVAEASAGGPVSINPGKFDALPEVVQLFVVCHECGHVEGNQPELNADSYAVACGKSHGETPTRMAEAGCQLFGNMPASGSNPAGADRCANLKRTAQCLESAGGANQSCLQVAGDPGGAGAGGGGGAAGGGFGGMESLISQIGQQWMQNHQSSANAQNTQNNQSTQPQQPQTPAQPANQQGSGQLASGTTTPAAPPEEKVKLGSAGFVDARSSGRQPGGGGTDSIQAEPQSVKSSSSGSKAPLSPQSAAMARQIETQREELEFREEFGPASAPGGRVSPASVGGRTPSGLVIQPGPASDVAVQRGPALFQITSVAYGNYVQRHLPPPLFYNPESENAAEGAR